MLIGLTYDLKDDYLKMGYEQELVAEFDSLQTIEAIEQSLRDLGHETVRIGNLDALVRFLADGNRCPLVFNIAEGLFGLAREAQVPALLEAYRIPHVFSDALVLAVCLHKGMAKAVVSAQRVPTAGYRVLDETTDLSALGLPYPLFIKPVGGGTGMGIGDRSLVRDEDELRRETMRQIAAFGSPVLAETFLEGREFTVGIVGTGERSTVLGVMEILVDGGIYSYKTKQEYKRFARYRLVEGPLAEHCASVALGAWKALGCKDGGRVDLKADGEGRINFLEVNPLAGLNPVDSDLPILCSLAGIGYRTLIARIMESALERMEADADHHSPRL